MQRKTAENPLKIHYLREACSKQATLLKKYNLQRIK
jgi:hypothetical protein